MKKYKLVKDQSIVFENKTLYRIKALKNFGYIKKGDLGGYIEFENNLSQEDNCWVYDEAKVFDNAKVYGNAQVYGSAKIYDDAWVFGNAWVHNSFVFDYAKVFGNVWVYGNAKVFGNAWVFGNAKVYGNAKVFGDAQVYGEALVCFKVSGVTIEIINITAKKIVELVKKLTNVSITLSLKNKKRIIKRAVCILSSSGYRPEWL